MTAEGLALDQRGTGRRTWRRSSPGSTPGAARSPRPAAAWSRSTVAARGRPRGLPRDRGRRDRDRRRPPRDALDAVAAVIDPWLATGDVLWGVPLVTLGLRAAAERAEVLRAAASDRPGRPGGRRRLAPGACDVARQPGRDAGRGSLAGDRRGRAVTPGRTAGPRAVAPGDRGLGRRHRSLRSGLRSLPIRGDGAAPGGRQGRRRAELVAAWRSAVELGAEALQARSRCLLGVPGCH